MFHGNGTRAHGEAAEPPAGQDATGRGDEPASRLALNSVTITMSRVRGPCTPSTRLSSMSLVALGPLIHVSGRAGSSAATASGTAATICPVRTTARW